MTMTGKPGEVAILNCTTGDTKISFDPAAPAEVARARSIVQDMLRRGYCLAVMVEGRMERVVEFDPKTCEYVVQSTAPTEEPTTALARRPGGRKKGTPNLKRYSASGHSVVAVGQTAGGGLGCPTFAPEVEAVRSLGGVRVPLLHQLPADGAWRRMEGQGS